MTYGRGRCRQCEASLWAAGRRRSDAKFCSADCRVAAHRAGGYKNPPIPPRLPRDLICTQCGEKFSQSGRGSNRLICYDEACVKAKKLADSRVFHERRVTDGRWDVQKAKRRKHEPRPCADCGKTLRIGYRCRPCGQMLRQAIGKTSRITAHRRAVFERDGWICQLCDKPIDPGLTGPAPLSASIDHVKPLRELMKEYGADFVDDEANWQAAHLVCNTRKGARP